MLKSLKKELPDKCLVGFAYKYEYGLEKSFHIHAMLFLSGREMQRDEIIARMIGEHWNNVITAGKGLYYNCNAHKSKYKSCGIGMVNHYEPWKIEGINQAAYYMTKTDSLIKMIAPGNSRTFTKGNMPKRTGNKRGRPRQSSFLDSTVSF